MGYLGRLVLSVGAVALFAGCGGSASPPIGAPGTMPQGRATVQYPGRAWMLPEASSETLVYTSRGCGGTCVLSYTNGNVVGSLPAHGGALCSDHQGDVFISSYDEVVEYAHGGSEPIATLSLPGIDAAGCSVDPETGNLAVVFVSQDYDIAVFPAAEGTPTLYSSGLESFYCGYDNAGNLFVSGYNWDSNHPEPGLSELALGSATFETLSISDSVGPDPYQIQWDGQYMAYEGGEKRQLRISRLSVSGSQVNIVQTITLKGIKGWPGQSWIYGNHILVPYSNHGSAAKNLGLWKYPKGGAKVRGFNFGTYKTQLNMAGVTVSVAPSR